MADLAENTLSIKEKWKMEFNVTIEDGTWEDTDMSCHKGINSNTWKEFDWKTKVRFLRTPLLISSYYKGSTSPLCWRNCGLVGDHSHIFWDCPALQQY